MTRLSPWATWTLGAAVVLMLPLSRLPGLRQTLHLNVAMIYTKSWATGHPADPQRRIEAAERALAAWEGANSEAATFAVRQAEYGPYLRAYLHRAESRRESQQVKQLYDAGQRSAVAGDYSQAAALFRTVLEHDPYYVEAYIGLLRAWRAMGDTAAAQEVQADLLNLAPPCRLGEQTPARAWQEVEWVQM